MEGTVGTVNVLRADETFTSLEVRNEWGRVVATLEVYGGGKEVYASAGENGQRSRNLARHEEQVELVV